MPTVLLTGGAGFIGSHVARAYLAKGLRVAVVDDLSCGRRDLLPAGVEFYELDVRDPNLEDVFRRVRPDVVNHHAAQVSVLRSTREPQLDASVNVTGAVNVLELSSRHAVRRFIFSSTGGALYGEPQRLPCDEAHPIMPLSPYGVSKYCVEQYVRYYSQTRGMASVILRYANVYGPEQDPFGEAGVVAIFTQRLLTGQQAFIFGNGEQERDFVYVEDVARANVLALDHGDGQAFNIATGQALAITDLYRVLAKITGNHTPPQHKGADVGEVFRIYLDASKARRELGWAPTLSLEEGLRKTVAAFAAAEAGRQLPPASL